MVERQPSKLNVAGSNPVSRSKKYISNAFGFIAGSIFIYYLKKGFLLTNENLRTIGFDLKGDLVLKKIGVLSILAVILLSIGTWVVLAEDTGGEAIEYFPLKEKNFWAYKISLPNNETYSQIVAVNSQIGQNIRAVVLINQMPWMEIAYIVNEEGLFRTKQISAQGVEVIEPRQMVLASKLNAGVNWNWEAADQKGKETARVIGKEKVTVPVGTFDALLVQYEGVYKDGTVYLEKTWFVKGIGYIKVESSAGDQTITKELVEYKVN